MNPPSPGTVRARADERRVATAVVEEHRAGAEERRARARAAEVTAQAEARRIEAAAKVELSAAKKRYADEARERAAARRAVRRLEASDRRSARWSAVRESAPDWGLSALWAAVIVSPLLLAWDAQANFAQDELGFPPEASWLFPLAVEAGAWACAFEAARRTNAGRPAGRLVMWMWVLAGVAGTINFTHGWQKFGSPAHGLALGILSVLGVLLHHVRQSLDRAAADEAAGRSTVTLQTRAGRWVWHPILSMRAVSIRARSGACSSSAWEQAHIDRYGAGPEATRLERKLGRALLKHQRKAAIDSVKKGEVPQGWAVVATAAAGETPVGTTVVTRLVPSLAFLAAAGELLPGIDAPVDEDTTEEAAVETSDVAATAADGPDGAACPPAAGNNLRGGKDAADELPATAPGNFDGGKSGTGHLPRPLPGGLPGHLPGERHEDLPDEPTAPAFLEQLPRPAGASQFSTPAGQTETSTGTQPRARSERASAAAPLSQPRGEVSSEVRPPAVEETETAGDPPAWMADRARAGILAELDLARAIDEVAAEEKLEPQLLEVAVVADLMWRRDHKGKAAGRNPIREALRLAADRPIGSGLSDTYRDAARVCFPVEEGSDA